MTFFTPWLGPRLKYSCAWWPSASSTLAEAEDAMLALTCARAGLEDGMTVLDLGAGFGPLALWIAERYPSCRVIAVTNSFEQAAYLRGRGLRVTCADARAYEPTCAFDRVFAIELLEQLDDPPAMLARIARWLAPEGRLFLQALAGPPSVGDLLGGTMTSFELHASARLDRWLVPPEHAARTIAAWRANLAPDESREAMRWRRFLGDAAQAFGDVRVFQALFARN